MPAVPARPAALALAAGLAAGGAALYGIATGMLAALSPPTELADFPAFEVRVDRLSHLLSLALGLVLAGLALLPLSLARLERARPLLRAATAGAILAAGAVTATRWAALRHPTFSAQWSTWASVEAVAWLGFAFAIGLATWTLHRGAGGARSEGEGGA